MHGTVHGVLERDALIWHDEALRTAFASAGLVTLDDLVACELGQAVSSARTRACRKIELAGHTVFLKTQKTRRSDLSPRRWPSYALRRPPLVREADALRRLDELGVRTPRIVAEGARRDAALSHSAALVTQEVEGYCDLVRWLETAPERSAIDGTLAALDELVARLHERGYVLLGAKYRNVLVPARGAAAADELVLIDQPNFGKTRSRRLRAKDWRHLAFDKQRYVDAPSSGGADG